MRIEKKASSKLTILNEGKVKRGGLKSQPSSPKPNIKPPGQKPVSK
jgi:hypothetical protein